MAELRWHPLIKDWVMIASHRQNRPQMPKDWCPFCPGSGKVPDNYDVLMYENDFPALSQTPPVPDDVAGPLFKVDEAYGRCEVILYSPKHTITLPELPLPHVRKLVDLWTERFAAMAKDGRIKYIFIFENRGSVVGVTMPHPHGQIYGYPFIPKKIELEIDACSEYYAKNGKCLVCDLIAEEKKAGLRVIFENEDFLVYLPFYVEYPYGMYIASKSHKQDLTQLDSREKDNLAAAIKDTAGTLDALFGYQFPYMMCMHQNPVNSNYGAGTGKAGEGAYAAKAGEGTDAARAGDGTDASGAREGVYAGNAGKGPGYGDFYHFHIEFFPPMRSAEKQKFNASSETGAWAHCNPTSPEEKAEELREAYRRYKKTNNK